MIKIVQPGKEEFQNTCDTCGCVFSYGVEDLDSYLGNNVKCPFCGYYVAHPKQEPLTMIEVSVPIKKYRKILKERKGASK